MEKNRTNRPNKNKSKSKNAQLIICFIIIILLLILGYYLLFVRNKNNNKNIEDIDLVELNVVTGDEFKLTKEEFPKINGSTSSKNLIKEITKQVIGITDEEANEYVTQNCKGTTSEAFNSLINKEVDLIISSEPSDSIINQAKDNNVEFDMTGIGYDGFLFIVNKQNPVKSLTFEQIRKIYTGEFKNWKDVGGDNAQIIIYQRDKNSESQNLLEKMVTQSEEITNSEDTSLIVNSNEEMINDISEENENSKYAIGYSVYPHTKEEQNNLEKCKILEINEIKADGENIKNKTYPLTKVVYAITRKDVEKESKTRELINWFLTDKGQETIESVGYSKIVIK